MRRVKYLWLAIALLFPAVVRAAQVYGSVISEGGGGVSNATIEITCGGAVAATGVTAADGSYRINVGPQGQCNFALPTYKGRPSAVIFSGPNPSAYNFELVHRSDGDYELRRR
jgi:hypothetical protein